MGDNLDKSVFERILQGDNSAVELAISEWHPAFAGFLAKMVPMQDALDIAQETYIKMIKKFHTFSGLQHARRFLYKTGYRKAVDFIRRKKKLEEISKLIIDQHNVNEMDVISKSDITSAIDTLSVKEKAVVSLKVNMGLSSVEIASHLGIPLGTVLFRSYTAINKLRKFFLASGYPYLKGGIKYESVTEKN